ncbi:hypothetical protein DFH29DRAFT_1082437 [Suillus ampliporus]|nr:hypothetical protein DFH29DRAFT_1082437 [Suillus ampliporus]
MPPASERLLMTMEAKVCTDFCDRFVNDSLSISRSLSTSEVQRVIMRETATAHSSVRSPSPCIHHPHAAAAMLSH